MMDKGTRSPRKGDKSQRKKKRKKCSCKKRPHKPEPGKYSTSPELSDPGADGAARKNGSALSVSGQQSGIYSSTLNFDPRGHLTQIQKAPKPLSDTLERLAKPRQPKATSITAPSSVRSEPTLGSNRHGYGVRVSQVLSDTRLEIRNESLRWDNAESDEEKESERIRMYKVNRRKRYLAAANENGNDWSLASTSCTSLPSSPHQSENPSNEFSQSNSGRSSTHRKHKRRSRSRSSKRSQSIDMDDDKSLDHLTSAVSDIMVSDVGSLINHASQNLPQVAINV